VIFVVRYALEIALPGEQVGTRWPDRIYRRPPCRRRAIVEHWIQQQLKKGLNQVSIARENRYESCESPSSARTAEPNAIPVNTDFVGMSQYVFKTRVAVIKWNRVTSLRSKSVSNGNHDTDEGPSPMVEQKSVLLVVPHH
jgi:hypothetical protein